MDVFKIREILKSDFYDAVQDIRKALINREYIKSILNRDISAETKASCINIAANMLMIQRGTISLTGLRCGGAGSLGLKTVGIFELINDAYRKLNEIKEYVGLYQYMGEYKRYKVKVEFDEVSGSLQVSRLCPFEDSWGIYCYIEVRMNYTDSTVFFTHSVVQ